MSWLRVVASLLAIAAMFVVGFALVRFSASRSAMLQRHAPVVIEPEHRLPPVAVRPPAPVAPVDTAPELDRPLLRRRRLPVQITMYCLAGTTRTGRPVREGIIAADPRLLPLGTVVDLYVGLRYRGRYLVDDTGGVIKGAIVDVWTPSCADARRFGRRRGAVVMVEPPARRRR